MQAKSKNFTITVPETTKSKYKFSEKIFIRQKESDSSSLPNSKDAQKKTVEKICHREFSTA